MIDDYETAIKIEEGKYADVNTFKTMQKNIDQLREENKKLREVNLFNKDIKDLKILKIGDVCYIDDPITTHEILKDRVKQLEEENQKLKTEIEKIKLDYIGRAVKLHKALKRSADLAHKKEFQCLNCWRLNYWDKRCKELESNIEILKSENELFKNKAFYWQARFETAEQDNHCFRKDGKPCKVYERLRKKLNG